MIELRRRAKSALAHSVKNEIPAVLLPPVIKIKMVGNSAGKTQSNKTCPKCGKHCERGLHIHMKYCKA